MTESVGLPFCEVLSAAELEALWEPMKARLVREDRENDLRVRIHRACRALEQAELAEGDGSDPCKVDVALILRWISLNALYSHWDREAGRPRGDRDAINLFTSKISRLDEAGRITAALDALRSEALTLLESPFLIERFWRAGEWENIRPQRGHAKKFAEELREVRPAAAHQRLLSVVYFLRCQLVHGGSTLGGSMNRANVDPAARVLQLLASQLIALAIERGIEADWGELCYPPV